jgi:hypothetical protein
MGQKFETDGEANCAFNGVVEFSLLPMARAPLPVPGPVF